MQLNEIHGSVLQTVFTGTHTGIKVAYLGYHTPPFKLLRTATERHLSGGQFYFESAQDNVGFEAFIAGDSEEHCALACALV
jgi:hypothetical protein